MEEYTNYYAWLADGGWIRNSARAITFNPTKDKILIEKNFGNNNTNANFIGGGVEVGETLQECIERELFEETNAKIKSAKYLFVVENFITYQSEIRHALDHIFQIELDREDVIPKSEGIAFTWTPINQLHTISILPQIVRDSIITGTYKQVTHLILRQDGSKI